MDALLMCGGEGSRLAATLDRETAENGIEKPLYRIGGRPMVERVLAALDASAVDRVHAVVTPDVPETREYLDGRVELIETPGEGYVPDLANALETVGAPALTAVADLPLLDAAHVDAALEAHEAGPLTVCVPAALERRLGVSVETTLDPAALDAEAAGAAPPAGRVPAELAPVGLNVATDDETACTDTVYLSYDARLAVNVNRRRDATVAEELL